MEEKTYIQKLQDPRWQRKRLEIMQHDGFKCQHCGSIDKPLQIHHIAYNFKDPWEIESRLLISLCADCHDAETLAIKEAFSRLIQNIKSAGCMAKEVNFLADMFHESNIDVEPPTILNKIFDALNLPDNSQTNVRVD